MLEGGSIDVNGKGTVLTTEECLLDPVTQIRNPGFTRRDYEAVLERVPGGDERPLAGPGHRGRRHPRPRGRRLPLREPAHGGARAARRTRAT